MRTTVSVDSDRITFGEAYDRTGYIDLRLGRHCTMVGHCEELADFAKRLLALSERLIKEQEERAHEEAKP